MDHTVETGMTVPGGGRRGAVNAAKAISISF
jgi:hypothetical protein